MHRNTLAQSAAALKARTVSSVELTRHYLDRIERLDPKLNSFITVTRDQALAEAELADQRIARGDDSALLGVPIAHKDIFCTAGIKTTCGSRMLDEFVSPYDATVVERLAHAGAVVLGKTNMDEFAMGSSSETSYFGVVRNPWDTSKVPGGSSGGSAAAVAAGLWCRCYGYGYGRLYSPAGSPVRTDRREADIRSRIALRDDRIRIKPRSGWHTHSQCRRRGDDARCDGRIR